MTIHKCWRAYFLKQTYTFTILWIRCKVVIGSRQFQSFELLEFSRWGWKKKFVCRRQVIFDNRARWWPHPFDEASLCVCWAVTNRLLMCYVASLRYTHCESSSMMFHSIDPPPPKQSSFFITKVYSHVSTNLKD